MSNTSFEMYPLSSISSNIINNAFNIELLRPTTCSNQTGQVRNTKVRATNHLSLTLSSFFLARQHSKIVKCSLSLCFPPWCEFLSISPEILLLFFNFLLNFFFLFCFWSYLIVVTIGMKNLIFLIVWIVLALIDVPVSGLAIRRFFSPLLHITFNLLVEEGGWLFSPRGIVGIRGLRV